MNDPTLTKRRVTFPDSEDIATVVCYIPTRKEWSAEEVRDVYFSKAEYCAIREKSRSAGYKVSRSQLHLKLDDVFTEKCSASQERLNAWAAHGKLRGLERWANREHGEKREHHQFHGVMAVLRAQDEHMARKRRGGLSKDNSEDVLRKVSYNATKLARHFARMMGKADFYAATAANEEDSVILTIDSKSLSTDNTDHLSMSLSTLMSDDISLPRCRASTSDSVHNKNSSHSRNRWLSESTDTKKPRALHSRLPAFMHRQISRRQCHDKTDTTPSEGAL
jgi:hypothetical protein